jgi:hypothetical protein
MLSILSRLSFLLCKVAQKKVGVFLVYMDSIVRVRHNKARNCSKAVPENSISGENERFNFVVGTRDMIRLPLAAYVIGKVRVILFGGEEDRAHVSSFARENVDVVVANHESIARWNFEGFEGSLNRLGTRFARGDIVYRNVRVEERRLRLPLSDDGANRHPARVRDERGLYLGFSETLEDVERSRKLVDLVHELGDK